MKAQFWSPKLYVFLKTVHWATSDVYIDVGIMAPSKCVMMHEKKRRAESNTVNSLCCFHTLVNLHWQVGSWQDEWRYFSQLTCWAGHVARKPRGRLRIHFRGYVSPVAGNTSVAFLKNWRCWLGRGLSVCPTMWTHLLWMDGFNM